MLTNDLPGLFMVDAGRIDSLCCCPLASGHRHRLSGLHSFNCTRLCLDSSGWLSPPNRSDRWIDLTRAIRLQASISGSRRLNDDVGCWQGTTGANEFGFRGDALRFRRRVLLRSRGLWLCVRQTNRQESCAATHRSCAMIGRTHGMPWPYWRTL